MATVSVHGRPAPAGRQPVGRHVQSLANVLLCIGVCSHPLIAQRRLVERTPCTGAPRADACLVTLGTGMPRPDPRRSGPASAIVIGNRTILVDAGPGVMRRLSEAGLAVDRIERTIITHLHSDHTLGLPDVIYTGWVMGRRTPLALIGPPGLAAMTRHFAEAWSEDMKVRIEGLEHGQRGGERTDVTESTGGVVHDSAGVRVELVRVDHGDWAHAFGVKVSVLGRTFVISGDTRPSAALEAAATGADVLVHEAYPAVRLAPERRPGGETWPAYMRAFHTSDEELGALAQRARVKLLVVHHVVWMGGTEAELRAGIRKGGYSGPLRIAKDLDAF